MVLVEACVESVLEARAAEAGGAGRVELCANLAEGGVTPTDAVIAACVQRLRIPVFVMVRPRPGDFLYSGDDIRAMCTHARQARDLGASGIVTGALAGPDAVDEPALRALVTAAAPLPVTFHRAFDLLVDRGRGLDALMACGAARVLTGGGPGPAMNGLGAIARVVEQARSRLAVVAAGGIRGHNVRAVVAATGVTEVHAHVTTEADTRALTAVNLRPRPA